MKRSVCLFLVVLFVCLSVVPVFGEHESKVSYEGQGVSSYLLTVPAELAPGESDNVILSGTWSCYETIYVTVDDTVVLENDIDHTTKTLDISFNNLEVVGDNTSPILVEEGISVEDIENALFGTWSGKFNYYVRIDDISDFADNSWERIIEFCESGEVPATWSVGDTKTMEIGDSIYTIRIIGKNHDVYSDGSGVAPLTFQLVESCGEYAMNKAQTNRVGWIESELRTVTMPQLLADMPDFVQAAIKPVDKETIMGKSRNYSAPTTIEITSDKLFVLSETEFKGTVQFSKVPEGKQYSYYQQTKDYAKGIILWLRGPSTTDYYQFTGVDTNGSLGQGYSHNTFNVMYAFCF